MRSPWTLSEIKFTPASFEQRSDGLVAFVAVTLNGSLRIDGITVRRSLTGRLYVAFPRHRDSRGEEQYVVRPLDQETTAHLESQILAAFHMEEASR
jgi:DNA-binding cell septation regulator SpoVG